MVSDIGKYVQDTSGNVFKVLEDHFLKLSPWEGDEDRRIVDIDNKNYHMIAYNNACMIINKQFAEKKEVWDHNGKHYIANILNISTKDDIEEHTFRLRLLPDHKILLDDEGESELKLIKHKGKLYYILLLNDFYPTTSPKSQRVKAYTLFGKFAQWVGIQQCKPVFCTTDGKYI